MSGGGHSVCVKEIISVAINVPPSLPSSELSSGCSPGPVVTGRPRGEEFQLGGGRL